MAEFSCAVCDHEGHYTEFKIESDEATEHQAEEPDRQCPLCQSSAVYEL